MCGVHRPDVTTIEQSEVILSELEHSLLANSLLENDKRVETSNTVEE